MNLHKDDIKKKKKRRPLVGTLPSSPLKLVAVPIHPSGSASYPSSWKVSYPLPSHPPAILKTWPQHCCVAVHSAFLSFSLTLSSLKERTVPSCSLISGYMPH